MKKIKIFLSQLLQGKEIVNNDGTIMEWKKTIKK